MSRHSHPAIVRSSQWTAMAHAARDKKAIDQLLSQVARALQSDDPATFLPPLQCAVRMGATIGYARISTIVSEALYASTNETKDRRLADCLLALAAVGSDVARESLIAVAAPDSGYVAATEQLRNSAASLLVRAEYAHEKARGFMMKQHQILEEMGLAEAVHFTVTSRLAVIETYQPEPSSPLRGGLSTPTAEANLAWFFLHGTETDRASLAIKLGVLQQKDQLPAFFNDTIALLQTEKDRLHDLGETDGEREFKKAIEALRKYPYFQRNRPQAAMATLTLPSSSPVAPPVSDIDKLRDVLNEETFDSTAAHRLVTNQKLPREEVLAVLAPSLRDIESSRHADCCHLARLVQTDNCLSLLEDAARAGSSAAATALAEIAIGRAGNDRNFQAKACSSFWAANNYAPLLRTPKEYFRTVGLGAILSDMAAAADFARNVIFPLKDKEKAREVLYLMTYHRLFEEPLPPGVRRPISAVGNLLNPMRILIEYFNTLTPADISALKWKGKMDIFLYDAVSTQPTMIPVDKKLAVAEFYCNAGKEKGNELALDYMSFMMQYLPLEEQPRFYQVLRTTKSWFLIASAIFDASVERLVQMYSVDSLIRELTPAELRLALDQLPAVAKHLIKTGRVYDCMVNAQLPKARAYAEVVRAAGDA